MAGDRQQALDDRTHRCPGTLFDAPVDRDVLAHGLDQFSGDRHVYRHEGRPIHSKGDSPQMTSLPKKTGLPSMRKPPFETNRPPFEA